MKKTFKLFLAIFTLSIVIYLSCSKNSNIEPANSSVQSLSINEVTTDFIPIPLDSSSQVYVTTFQNTTVKNILEQRWDSANLDLNKIKTALGLTSITKSDFNFVNLYKGRLDSSSIFAFAAPFISTNLINGDTVTYAFVLFQDNETGTFFKPTFVRTIKGKSVRYLDIDGYAQLTINTTSNQNNNNLLADNKTQVDVINSIITEDFTLGGTSLSNKTNVSTNSSGGCGQATSNCIADAYLNHGWASVYLFVQSSFLPVTAAAIAGVCAGKNCILN